MMEPEYSRLFLHSDSAGWVLDHDRNELAVIAGKLGIRAVRTSHLGGVRKQAVFFASQFMLLGSEMFQRDNRVAFAYFHGRSVHLAPEFEACRRAIEHFHPRVSRIQVTNRAFLEFVLGTGIDPAKVSLIPIGVHLSYFPRQTADSKRAAREALDIPQEAAVIGSFQKDGVGWGLGSEPKLIKGPDIFLQVMERVKASVPNLFVLLSGPARGYIVSGLEKGGVPFRYVGHLPRYADMGQLYQSLDMYLVSSREEGGPMAVLESMACGVPLVTTRVGQAADLVDHGRNGWIAEVDDVEALAHWTRHVIEHRANFGTILEDARRTAEAHAFETQIPLWRKFFEGWVNFP